MTKKRLQGLVSRRRRLMRYMVRNDYQNYRCVLTGLPLAPSRATDTHSPSPFSFHFERQGGGERVRLATGPARLFQVSDHERPIGDTQGHSPTQQPREESEGPWTSWALSVREKEMLLVCVWRKKATLQGNFPSFVPPFVRHRTNATALALPRRPRLSPQSLVPTLPPSETQLPLAGTLARSVTTPPSRCVLCQNTTEENQIHIRLKPQTCKNKPHPFFAGERTGRAPRRTR